MLVDARGRAAEIIFILCIVGLVISTAWMCDDAFITLRTIDNFWNGYGLRWNAMERVQSYTHPLWLMLVGSVYGLTREPYLTTIVLSMACTAAMVAVLLTRIAESAGGRLVALALLAGSKSFIEFSTSGLENPLTHLLFTVLLWQYWESPTPAARIWRVAWLTGLCGLNRLDSLAFAGPLLLYTVWTARSAKATATALVGLLPLAAWELFSVFYYGFPFPNTVYAKMVTGIPRDLLITRGLYYFRDTLIADPITLPAIAAALVVLACSRRGDDRMVGVALAVSLLFVVLVGGDYMTGRFFSAPFVVAVLTLCRRVPATAPRWALLTASVVVTLWSASSAQSPWRVWPRPSIPDQRLTHGHDIVDERVFYYHRTGLLNVLSGVRVDTHGFAMAGLRWRMWPQVQLFGAVGMAGFHAGPGTHIIDTMALADPLLASLPNAKYLIPGHYERPIPAGYVETVERCLSIVFRRAAVVPPETSCYESPSRVNSIEDPKIATLYDRLALITQAPLFDRRRLRAILEVNLDRLR
jgi:arabinofuranosyltransferase